jgi:hypothetical protein
MATIKITELTSIGANLTSSTVIPVVNMSGTPTTEKTLLGNIANVVLTGAGNSYSPAGRAILAQSVTNAAQPNITSVGTLTSLAVSGNVTVNGNITSNGTAYVGNLSTTGLASITTLAVGATANLGAAGNVKITGGTDGYVLQTDGAGNLSWTAQTGGGGNGTVGGANTQVQFNDAGDFGGNAGFTFDKTTGIFTSPFIAGNGNGLSNIQGANVSGAVNLATFAGTANAVAGANVSGTVGDANLSQFIDVSSVNNNFSYHIVLSAGDGDKSIHIDADDNLQYNPADGTLTAVRVDATYVLADLQFSNGYPAANVTGLGNIAITNYDGNASNVLHGDGTWSADTTTYGDSNVVSLLSAFGSNTITTTGNVSVGNIIGNSTIDIDNRVSGNTADIRLFSADDIVLQARDRTLGSTSEGGDINLYAGDSAEDSDSSGGDVVIEAGAGGASNVDFGGSGGFITIQSGRGGAAIGNTGYTAQNGGDLTLSAGDAGDNNGNIDLGSAGGAVFIESGYSTGGGDYGGEIVLTTGTGGQNAASGNVRIVIPGYGLTTGGIWKFDGTGNLTLPGNTFAVNYANGTQVSIGGGGNVSELVNGDNSFILDGDGNVVFEGNVAGQAVNRGLVWDYGANANGVNSTVVQNNGGLSVRAWTEDSGNYAAPVNIITNQNANTKQWIFDGNGNLTLPGNLIVPEGNIESATTSLAFSSAITGITTGNATVIVTLADPVFVDPFQGEVTISSVTGTTEANGVWGYQATDPNEFQLYTDSTLTTPVDGTTWTAYVSGGDAVSIGTYTDFTIQGGNVSIGSNDSIWVFGIDGNLTLPAGGIIHETGIPFGGLSGDTIALKPAGGTNADQQLLIYPTAGQDFNHLHLTSGNLYNTELFLGDDNFNIKLANTGNIIINTNDSTGNVGAWTFGFDSVLSTPVSVDIVAGTSLPGLETDYTDSVVVLSDAFTQNSGEVGYPWGITLPVSYLTYNELILLAPGTFPNQMAVTTIANNTKNTYQVWQDAIAETNVTLTANELNWTFGNDGKLTFPGTPCIDTADDNFEVQAAEAINFEANTVVNIYTDTGNNAFQWQFGDDGVLTLPGNLVAVTASPAPRISGFSSVSALAFTNGNSNVTVNANSNLWNFDSTGNLTIPGSSGGFIKTMSNASIGIAAMDNGTNNPAQLLSLNVGTGAATSIVSAYATNVAIQTNAAGAINTWAFDNAGNLTLPGNTVTINFANGSAAFGNMVQWTTAPIANTSAGAAGQAAYDSGGNLYVCVSANTWAKFTGTTSW